MNWFNSLSPVIQTLLATIFTWGVTALGALVVCFFKEMNKKVKELGLKNTHFVNCTGFDEENHYSTASDMVKIAMELVNNYPDVYKFSSVYESYVRENTPNKTWIANTNKLVRFYEGADGLKTGSTNDAGKCIVATAKRNGLRLIAISLGYKDVTTRNKETMDLLDYGFNQYEINMLYEKDKKVGTVNVDKVNEKIDLYAKEDIFILKKKIDESISYQYEIVLDNVSYPIKKGQKIATLYVKDNNTIVKKSPLVVNKDINKMSILKLYFYNLKDILAGLN